MHLHLQRYLRGLGQRSVTTFWDLASIMVPILILMRVAETFGLIAWMSPAFRPVMALVNLPPEAAIICFTTLLTGIYGGMATLPVLIGLDLTEAQVTSICAFMLIAHALPIEQAIVRKAGGSFWGTFALRFFGAILAMVLIHWMSAWTGFLSAPQSMDHLAQYVREDAGHVAWAWSSFKAMIVLFFILVGLLLMMDGFDRFGVTKVINALLSPVMRLSGLDRSVTTITTAGVVLGLSYGGGLIIAKSREGSISPAAIAPALYWLSLCHSLIEDTALLVAVGGNIWVLLFGRVVFSLVVIRVLMVVMRMWGRRAA